MFHICLGTVYNQPSGLGTESKIFFELDHLEGERLRSVKCFTNDSWDYVSSLKRLKFLFGQKSKIAEAALCKLSREKQF